MSGHDMKELLKGLGKEKQDDNESQKGSWDYSESDNSQKRSYQPTKSELDDDNPPEDDD